MTRRFVALFVLTTTLLVLAAAAGSSAASGDRIVAGVVAAVLGIPAILGLIALARIVYLDGKAPPARPEGGSS